MADSRTVMTHADLTEARDYSNLASYRRCVDRIARTWPAFAAQRSDRLRQGLFGSPVEKVAENILEDLFTKVLDWSLPDVNLQIGRADVVLSDLGIKRLVLEVKRPGALAWHQTAVHAALDQAMGYAAAQKVGAVAVSDGQMLYAADVVHGGLMPRIYVGLDAREPPLDLWWISVHGIYRPCPAPSRVPPKEATVVADSEDASEKIEQLLHHRYQLPARCFAFVGSANDPATWKLPYLLIDGLPDLKRLPKAIQSILSNYRGVKVSIPRETVPDVLVRLAKTAAALGRMPCQGHGTAEVYSDAHEALDQLERLRDVGCCTTG
jgi:hypothetical protein